jgi:cobalt-zinc-cadmium efflux system protein
MVDHSTHAMPMPGMGNERALKISAWLTGVYFLIELGIGVYSGSIAVISDAFHTFSAVGGVVLAFIAARIARRPADHLRSLSRRDHRRAPERRLSRRYGDPDSGDGRDAPPAPRHLPTTPMLIAAAGGIVTELISLKLLYGGQKGDLNLRGAFWHVMQTFIGSILIIIAAAVIYFTGFLPIDPLWAWRSASCCWWLRGASSATRCSF